MNIEKITPIAGILTCLILYSVILIAAVPYVGQQDEPYSVFNHFISELGNICFSTHYMIYNTGLIVSSIGFALFTYGLGLYIDSRASRRAMYIGVFSSVLCVGVGLVPENYRVPHLIIALCFFSIMTIAATLFAWSIWKGESSFARYSALHGFIIPIFFIIFMSMPKHLLVVKRQQGAAFERPEIWYLPFFEWCIFFALTSWILSISMQILYLEKRKG